MNNPEYESLVSRNTECECLYIDDFFRQNPTQADISLAFDILNSRYNTGKLTIISSEKTLSEILSADEALGGRIAQMCPAPVKIAKDRKKNRRIFSLLKNSVIQKNNIAN